MVQSKESTCRVLDIGAACNRGPSPVCRAKLTGILFLNGAESRWLRNANLRGTVGYRQQDTELCMCSVNVRMCERGRASWSEGRENE